MNTELLVEEARLQEAALKRLGRWLTICLAFSSVGVLIIYFAIASDKKNIWLIILGVIILLLGAAGGITIGLGIRNGRNNVRKILRAVEQERNPQVQDLRAEVPKAEDSKTENPKEENPKAEDSKEENPKAEDPEL